MDASTADAVMRAASAVAAVAGGRWRAEHVHVLTSRQLPIGPGRPAWEGTVALDWHDPIAAVRVRVAYHGAAWPSPQDAAAEVARMPRPVDPTAGPAVLHVPGPELVLWAWPNDPAVPQLGALSTPVGATTALPSALGPGWSAVTVDAVGHKPGRHAVLRVLAESIDGAAPPRVLYAKTYADDRWRTGLYRATRLWERAVVDGGPRVAETLGADVGTRTLWTASVSGRPLVDVLAGPDALTAVGAVARALAGLHDAPIELAAGGERRDLAHWQREIARRRRKLARLAPGLADEVHLVADALDAWAAAGGDMPVATAHGDAQFSQFVIDGDEAVVLDLDSMAVASPMEDLAEFIVKLTSVPVVDATPATLGDELVRAYAAVAPARYDAGWLAWHLAVQHLLMVTRTVVAVGTPSSALAARHLAAARASLDAAHRRPIG